MKERHFLEWLILFRGWAKKQTDISDWASLLNVAQDFSTFFTVLDNKMEIMCDSVNLWTLSPWGRSGSNWLPLDPMSGATIINAQG